MSKLRPEYTVERLHERQKGKLPDLLGLRVLSVDQGTLVAELTVREELLALLKEMRRARQARVVHRNHESAPRCARCGFQEVCGEMLRGE